MKIRYFFTQKVTACALCLMLFGLHPLLGQTPADKVTGRVTGSDGPPLIGVSVTIKGEYTRGSYTGEDGRYTLSAQPGDTLVFSYIGYQTREIPYTGRSPLNVTLTVVTTDLDAAVVVGYGVQRKRDITGSISSVKGSELNTTVAAANPLQGLQGKVAGVEVVQNSSPGGAPQIRVRGLSSFTNSNPCYVVDGLIMDDIAFLNPNEIESLEVLKDASATAIYGSRGANGVIIITTKQGRKNQPVTLNVEANVSVSEMSRYLDYANASEYLYLKNRNVMAQNAINGTSAPLPYTQDQIDAAGKGTDWQREITQLALTQNYNFNLVGGGKKSTYGLSGGYFNQEGIIKNSGYERANVKLSNTYELTRWATIGSNISYIYERRNSQGVTLASALRALPTAPVTDPDDPSKFFGPVDEIGKSGNPVAMLYYDSENYTNYYKTLANFFIKLEFVKNLVFQSSFSMNSSNSEGKSFLPAYEVNIDQRRTDNELNVNQSRQFDWLSENTLSYSFEKGKHSFSALAGITFQKSSSQNQSQNIKGMPATAWKNRNLWYTGLGEASTLTGTTGGAVFTYLSYLARINYNYDDRYLITATVRTDASSRFPINGRYGTFPAIGVGWAMHEESWMKNINWLNQMKLRASYGIVGSDAGIPNNIQTAYVNTVYGVFGKNPTGVTTSEVLDMVIDYGLRWEEARQLDLGLDFLALNGRLSFEFDYYAKTTSGVLTNITLPGISGTSYSPLSNIAKVRNTGIEFNLGWRENRQDFSYDISLIGTTLKNRVISVNQDVPPLENGANVTLVGYPIGGFWGYAVEGIYQDWDEIAESASISGATPGDLRYKDQNDDGVIDKDDRIYMGSYLPKVTLGLNLRFEYKGIGLETDLYSALGGKIYSTRRQTLGTSPYNVTTDYLNSWTGPGSTNSTTRVLLDGPGSNNQYSEYYLEDASYFKIRNFTLSYSFPRRIVEKMKMRTLKVYFSIHNLWTVTRATAYSPEIGGAPNAAGIDSFDAVYPPSRTFSFGINIGI